MHALLFIELGRTQIWVQYLIAYGGSMQYQTNCQQLPEFEKRWNRFARPAGRSWRCDETYVKICGVWHYLYRAVDREGNTVDFRLSPNRDVKAAKAFFRKALETQGRPPKSITLDGYAASHRAVRELAAENQRWKDTKLRSSKYLNNMVEQDHRGVKSRTGPMLGFRVFEKAAITIAGIELLNREAVLNA
jgi:transposase-like protein